jgi:hypothetical protein
MTCSESGLWCISFRVCQHAGGGEGEYRKRYASHLKYEGPKKEIREVEVKSKYLTKSGSQAK